jgi:hypothetical protein
MIYINSKHGVIKTDSGLMTLNAQVVDIGLPVEYILYHPLEPGSELLEQETSTDYTFEITVLYHSKLQKVSRVT